MTPGTAKSCWPPHVGKASLIVQASYWTPDDRIRDRLATLADVRLGADALAVAIGVRGNTESSIDGCPTPSATPPPTNFPWWLTSMPATTPMECGSSSPRGDRLRRSCWHRDRG